MGSVKRPAHLARERSLLAYSQEERLKFRTPPAPRTTAPAAPPSSRSASSSLVSHACLPANACGGDAVLAAVESPPRPARRATPRPSAVARLHLGCISAASRLHLVCISPFGARARLHLARDVLQPPKESSGLAGRQVRQRRVAHPMELERRAYGGHRAISSRGRARARSRRRTSTGRTSRTSRTSCARRSWQRGVLRGTDGQSAPARRGARAAESGGRSSEGRSEELAGGRRLGAAAPVHLKGRGRVVR